MIGLYAVFSAALEVAATGVWLLAFLYLNERASKRAWRRLYEEEYARHHRLPTDAGDRVRYRETGSA